MFDRIYDLLCIIIHKKIFKVIYERNNVESAERYLIIWIDNSYIIIINYFIDFYVIVANIFSHFKLFHKIKGIIMHK